MPKKTNSYSAYFGINRAINPGIRVLIDFLNNYFESNKKLPKIKGLDQLIDLNNIRQMEAIICKETDKDLNQLLYKSFFKWIESYSFYYSYINKNDTKYYLPLTKKMLYQDKMTRDRLKNILFKLLYPCELDYTVNFKNDKRNIEEYLFNRDETNIYSNIVQTLDMINENNSCINKDIKNHNHEDNFTNTFNYGPEFAKLLRADFSILLTHKYFRVDIYRRISLFTLLLNFYVTMYVINRSFDNKKVFILAKGSPDFTTETERFHKTCIENFSNIRERIFKVSEHFYEERIDYFSDNRQRLYIIRNEQDIMIFSKEQDIWPALKNELFSTRENSSLVEFVTDFLEVSYEEKKLVDRKALARAFVEWSKKNSSSVRMISGMFSGQGKEARMVFPVNSVKHKYYAMSSELTELLLKLFLASIGKEYATLDMFLTWLETRYGIYLSFSDNLMDYLNDNSIKPPSNEEFIQNVSAFINTLEGLSAIEKLSDNSYMVYDSGKIGGVSWLL